MFAGAHTVNYYYYYYTIYYYYYPYDFINKLLHDTERVESGKKCLLGSISIAAVRF